MDEGTGLADWVVVGMMAQVVWAVKEAAPKGRVGMVVEKAALKAVVDLV